MSKGGYHSPQTPLIIYVTGNTVNTINRLLLIIIVIPNNNKYIEIQLFIFVSR